MVHKLQVILTLALFHLTLAQIEVDSKGAPPPVVAIAFLSDTVLGQGAADVNFTLFKLLNSTDSTDSGWQELAHTVTWQSGHAMTNLDEGSHIGSVYKLVMETEP